MAREVHSSSAMLKAKKSQRSIRRKQAGGKVVKKPTRKPSAKTLASRRKVYAAKFFPYIEKVARRLARRLPAHVEIDDLVSAGVIGLMEAAERFDPKRARSLRGLRRVPHPRRHAGRPARARHAFA